MIIRLPDTDEIVETTKAVVCSGDTAIAAFVQRDENEFLMAFAGDSDFETVLAQAGYENHAAQQRRIKVNIKNETD